MCFYPVIGAVERARGGAVIRSSMLTEGAVPETFVDRQVSARKKDASYGEGGISASGCWSGRPDSTS
jgi:hypothetical protein